MNFNAQTNISLNITKPKAQIKYFIYNDKKYPVYFDLLKKNSNYFYINRKQFKNIENIDLLDEFERNFDITEECVQAFIASCQNEPYTISLSSIIPLHYLAYKFDFQELTEITTDIINENYEKLVLQKILFKSGDGKEKFKSQPFFDTKDDERFISKHLNKYINEDQIFELSFPVIKRIFQQYSSENEGEEISTNDMIVFLFKCLDHYGSPASFLFKGYNFKDETDAVRIRLLQNYSKKFDFNVLGSTLEKSSSEIIKEIEKQRENYVSIFTQKKEAFNRQILELNRIKNERMKNQVELDKMNEDKKDELDTEIKNHIENIESRFKLIEKKFEENYIEQEDLNNNDSNQKYLQVFRDLMSNEKP